MDNTGSQAFFCTKTNHVFADTQFILLPVRVLLHAVNVNQSQKSFCFFSTVYIVLLNRSCYIVLHH